MPEMDTTSDNEIGPNRAPDPPEWPEAVRTSERTDEGEGERGVEIVDNVFAHYTNPTVCVPRDHFTLSTPTTTIRYRQTRNAARVIEDADKQYILEETDDENGRHEITIRQIENITEGVRFLRATYALATGFGLGFLFIFAVQILLYAFLDLAIEFGITSADDPHYMIGLGVLLSVPPLIYGLSTVLVIVGVYIADTLRGHPLASNFTFNRFKQMAVEWLYFVFFIGVPCLSLGVSLLTGTDDFWAYTGLIWLISIFVFFSVFFASVVFYEVKACFEVMKSIYKTDDDSMLAVIKRSILLRQTATYGGYNEVYKAFVGSIEDAEQTDDIAQSSSREVEGSKHEYMSFMAKVGTFDVLQAWKWFEVIPDWSTDPIHTIDDARDVRPFLTAHTWSLEKIFCRDRRTRYIAIVAGPGSLTRAQMKSSVACSIIGTGLIFFLILALLVYLQVGAIGTIFLLVIAVWIFLPNLRSTLRLWKLSKMLIETRTKQKCQIGEDDAQSKSVRDLSWSVRDRGEIPTGQESSTGLYITTKMYRVTRPTESFALVVFCLEILIFFIWPLLSYFAIGNWNLGLLYLFIAGVSSARYYFNPALVLEATGHMDVMGGTSEEEKWTAQSRLNVIVGHVTRSRSLKVWNAVLGFLGLIFLALFAGAVGSGQEDASTGYDVPFTYVSKDLFQYKQLDALRYPTCTLSSDLGQSPLMTMADYTYLAGHAYRGTDFSQEELDEFFGEGVVTDELEIVQEMRESTIQSAVSVKVVSVNITSGSGKFAYLIIRGTTNPWDAMTDAQLWAPAALMQFLRIALPFGHIWTPVMPFLISCIALIDSASVEKISFYKDTVKFVEFLEKSGKYEGIAITGHSLGGGLSIITGAITKNPAVALSGPNAMLSRRSFRPMIDPDDLDKYTFNIIPERDIVPMLDDKAQNYQMIRCETEFSDVVGCHTALRSLCEIQYTCGSGDRPVICECVTDFGYPPPERVTDQDVDFMEACSQAKLAREGVTSGEGEL